MPDPPPSRERRWAAYYRSVVPARINPPALSRAISKRYPADPAPERQLRNLADEGSAPPLANLAWKIGQSLRDCLSWSSGPVALWQSCLFAEFVGFFATLLSSSEAASLTVDWWRVLPAMYGLKFIARESVIDSRPEIVQMYELIADRATPSRLHEFWDSIGDVFSGTDLLLFEKREEARAVWLLHPDDLKIFDICWKRWINGSRRISVDWDTRLKYAFTIAKSPDFSDQEKERFTIMCLISNASGGMQRLLSLLGAHPYPPLLEDDADGSETRESRSDDNIWRSLLDETLGNQAESSPEPLTGDEAT
ncbi:MAG: hypothetical protein M1314_02735 [Firmicutes bacterium]|nr:hypothetical protein [Bacillota bacterium]